MNLTKKEFKEICKYTVEIETDITADDTTSKILNRPPRFLMTTLWEKFEDYKNRVEKNPNSTRNKENLEYLKYLIRQRNIEIQVTPEEIESEIIERNIQKIEKENICGIYGYFDNKKEIYIYIGKDSNIGINLRDVQHHANDSQQINRILRNDKEGRYEYRVLETIENASVLALDIAERYYIKLFNTYHYENQEGMNFTKGGETSFGIETEAKIDHTKVTNKINRIYKGERDGIKMKQRPKGGKGEFKISTNGCFSDGTFRICLNTPNCDHEKQKTNIVDILDYYYENYQDEPITSTNAFEKNIGNFKKLHKLYLEGKLDKRTYNKYN